MGRTRNQAGASLAGAILVLIALVGIANPSHASGLNTNVALTPAEDGFIIRIQWRRIELRSDPTPLDREVHLNVQPFTVVYGVSANLALIGTLPIIHREIDFGAGGGRSDTGFGDIPLLAKYRFFQNDKPARTTRVAAIVGLEIPTYDSHFSSESFDPIIGVVWTHQRRDWWVDADLLYKFNTAGGLDGDDEFRADLATTIRLLDGESETIGPWGLYAIGEINASYLTDGSHQVFGSPGVQFITPNVILEAGVQLPIAQDLKSPRLETDYTVVVSARIQF